MLRRLLCAVFLAVFCYGNVAYAISNDAMAKKLQSTLRKELTGWIIDTARQACRQAGLDTPRNVSIAVEAFDGKLCLMSFHLSSYVPAEPVGEIARFVGKNAATILKKNGKCPDGLLILVLPGYGAGDEIYDAQAVLHRNNELDFRTIPKEELLMMLKESMGN